MFFNYFLKETKREILSIGYSHQPHLTAKEVNKVTHSRLSWVELS
jgi:hypothetical protein